MMVRTEGLEPSQPYGQGILSPLRLPFRHVRSANTKLVRAVALVASGACTSEALLGGRL